MKTILTFTPVWRRPEIFEICLQGIARLQKYNPAKYRIIPFFIVSEAEAATMVLKYGFDFIYHTNLPLGAKKNAGLSYVMEKYKFDYLMEIGSDDIIKNEYLDFLAPHMAAEIQQITPHDAWFIDTNTGKTAYWLTQKVIGLGRCIHYNALAKFEKSNYRLWLPDLNKGMDTCSWQQLLIKGIKNTLVSTNAIYTLDIKSDVNINTITPFKPATITPDELLSHFPESPQIQKLIINN